MRSLKEAFNCTADAVFGIDKDMRIRFWNKCCEDLFDITPEYAIGKCCHELVCGSDLLGNQFCSEQCPVIRHHDKSSPKGNWDLAIQPTDDANIVVNISSYYPCNHDDTEIYVFHSMRTIDCYQLIRRFAFSEKSSSETSIISRLSKREYEILRMLSSGSKPKSIATQLGISHATVRNHIKNIYSKLEVHSQAEVISCAIRHGII